MFVRVKYLKGKPYAYLVENEWTKNGSRQSVKGYLGRIHYAEQRPPPDLSTTPAEKLLQTIIDYETKGAEGNVDLDERAVRKGEQTIVIGCNGGYISDHTLKELFKALHVRNEERPGTALAQALSDAGLRIAPEDFIRLYKHHHP